MGKPAAVFGLILAALAILGIFAYTQLEIYPRTRRVEPSREVRGNEYLALERWLTRTGRSLRTEPWGSPTMVLAAPERTVFIQSSVFYWSGDTGDLLLPWIEGGGVLIIALDTPWYEDADGGLAPFLARLGMARTHRGDQSIRPVNPEDPDFDWDTAFFVPGDGGDALPGETLALTDQGGTIRLIRRSLGRGSVAVTGIPYFMHNFRLEKHQNAVMTWNLFSAGFSGDFSTGKAGITRAAGTTGAAGENPGVLLIRGKQTVRSFWGRLADRGNFTFLVISIPLVLVIGFWMVLPRFGPALRDGEDPPKSIRERFIAEGRFLQKYGALDAYLEVYLREIKLRLRGRGGGGEEEGPEELAARLLKIGQGKNRPGLSLPDIQTLTEALRPGKRRGSREFVKNLIVLQTILEYL
jgi:hypothetical protein